MQLKEKRDAAILEKHKEGMSNKAIAKLFGMTRQTVDNLIRDLAKNPESGKFASPESSTSAVPMASTEDRADTREDARSFIDEQLDALLTN
ncbi:helix-turn-helix domain-containing protein [Aeromonas veronii]|uniref:helix-turn-helix domain-containing protein n=1 Tax=Aeromonas veronii TaxID=654 RepID=UPI001D0A181B|nr:helix-turn-helix domain-containing protein [Aeromonas veronii]MCC0088186.1 helix-turn-helix domain-containing protein [Aeromonas veronii]